MVLETSLFTFFKFATVKEMYVRGQGEVRWGSRRSTLVVQEKRIGSQGEMHRLFLVSGEYNILSWPLIGPTNICLALIKKYLFKKKKHLFSTILIFLKVRLRNLFCSIGGPLSAQMNELYSLKNNRNQRFSPWPPHALLIDPGHTFYWPRGPIFKNKKRPIVDNYFY